MGKKIFTAVAAVLVLALVVTTLMDIEVPYLPIAVLALFLIAAGVHSKKTAISEIILDEENARFVLADGSVKEARRRDVVKLKVSGSRIVIVLKSGEDYNIPKRRAGAVIRGSDGQIRGLKEDDFPFAEVKKALG